VRSEQADVRADAGRELERALSEPTGTASLRQLSAGKHRACIVVSDKTRAVPSALLVEGIVEQIREQVSEIAVLFATGLHAPLTHSEMEMLVGPVVSACCTLVTHDSRDAANLVTMGSTPRGLPIVVNRTFAESDLRILTGLVEPHFMAGYSGGRKSVCPGIMGQRSIQYLHSPELLESPQADFMVLAGNPVHEEALRVTRAVGVDFIVNVALDRERQVSRVCAGDLEEAWLECVQFVAPRAQATVPHRFDIVITSNGGYPLDRNYYQAVKGLVAAARIVQPGGVILLVSECCDGLGSTEFRQALRTLISTGGSDGYLSFISDEDNWTIDQWEVEMLIKVLRRVSGILLYSRGIHAEDLPLTCAKPVASLEEGLREARKRLGETASIAVMPNGPYVIPTIAGETERQAGAHM
jgi:nickel-dependent lactate racemase